MICPFCQEDHPPDMRFCPETGQLLPETVVATSTAERTRCPACWSIIEEAVRFCPFCGVDLLGAAQAGIPPAPETSQEPAAGKPASEPKPRRRNGLRTLGIIFAGIAILAGVVMIGIGLSSGLNMPGITWNLPLPFGKPPTPPADRRPTPTVPPGTLQAVVSTYEAGTATSQAAAVLPTFTETPGPPHISTLTATIEPPPTATRVGEALSTQTTTSTETTPTQTSTAPSTQVPPSTPGAITPQATASTLASPTPGTPPPGPPLPGGGGQGVVAYTRGAENQWSVVLSDLATSKETLLPRQPRNSGMPSLAPGGKQLAFASNASGAWQIYTIDVDGNNLQQITSGSNHTMPAWSPDGSRIAYASDQDSGGGSEHQWEIYVMDRDGQNQRRITNNPGLDDAPDWSPDGAWLVYQSSQQNRLDIYKIRSDGSDSNPIQLTREGDTNSSPAWSPDGQKIAYVRMEGASFTLWTMSPDGSNPQSINTLNARCFSPAWSPDATQLLFASDASGSFAVWLTTLQAQSAPRRYSKLGGFDPTWARP